MILHSSYGQNEKSENLKVRQVNAKHTPHHVNWQDNKVRWKPDNQDAAKETEGWLKEHEILLVTMRGHASLCDLRR